MLKEATTKFIKNQNKSKNFSDSLWFFSFMLVFIILVTSFQLLLDAKTSSEPLKRDEIRSISKAIAEVFERKYILPKDGEKIAHLIVNNIENGDYDKLIHGKDLAKRLQKDTRSINGDRHITIYFSPEYIKNIKDSELQKKIKEKAQLRARTNNYGFKEIRILPGNIGYLKMNSFNGSQEAFNTATAAMQFLANSYAVIIDLRWNPGGDSKMVQFISSYFLGKEPKILDVFHFRENNRFEQLWSLPYVPGRSLEHADLYILTSGLTFSAAEGLAYDLKALNRATIVGETTMGGAHPVDIVFIKDKFLLNIPHAFSRNPITQKNFEGVGVKPDVSIDRKNALLKAHILAIKRRIAKEANKSIKAALKWALDGLPTQPIFLTDSVKKSYTGTYGPNKIIFENGDLYYLFGPGKLRMSPMTKDTFLLENFSSFRIKIVIKKDSVTGIQVHYENGVVQKYPRQQ
jgi:C-terminal processing protease CtpA/Prc